MLESSAQLPFGIIENENYHAEGLFDECLTIHSVPKRVRGQYCTVFFKTYTVDPSDIEYLPAVKALPSSITAITNTLMELFGSSIANNMTVKPKVSRANIWTLYYNYPSMSLCLPSSCSASDLGESMANLIGKFIISNQSIVTISDDSFCFSDDHVQSSFDGPDIAVM